MPAAMRNVLLSPLCNQRLSNIEKLVLAGLHYATAQQPSTPSWLPYGRMARRRVIPRIVA